jgi:AcrR family transcriptional regulator
MGSAGPARRLTRDDWVRAAMAVMAHGGARAVRVEPLAKELGASKGSFYWHFGDRDELIGAALERWEQRETQGVIEGLESIVDPRERLRRLLAMVHRRDTPRPDPSVALTGDREASVQVVLERVTARRIDFLAEQLSAQGLDAEEASRRATLAYTSYLGYAALVRSAPDALPAGEALVRYLDTVMTVLVSATSTHRDDG